MILPPFAIMSFVEYKIGDSVYSHRHGNGKVTDKTNDSISIDFEDNTHVEITYSKTKKP